MSQTSFGIIGHRFSDILIIKNPTISWTHIISVTWYSPQLDSNLRFDTKYVTKLLLVESRYPNPMLDSSSQVPGYFDVSPSLNDDYMTTWSQQHYSTKSVKLTSLLLRDSFVLCCVCNPMGLYKRTQLPPKKKARKEFCLVLIKPKKWTRFLLANKFLHGLMQKTTTFDMGLSKK